MADSWILGHTSGERGRVSAPRIAARTRGADATLLAGWRALMGATEPHAAPMRPDRLESVDLLRGLVMIIMALDHVRDFWGAPSILDPTNLEKTWPALFFTRWITHYCAPNFIFLAGVGA